VWSRKLRLTFTEDAKLAKGGNFKNDTGDTYVWRKKVGGGVTRGRGRLGKCMAENKEFVGRGKIGIAGGEGKGMKKEGQKRLLGSRTKSQAGELIKNLRKRVCRSGKGGLEKEAN